MKYTAWIGQWLENYVRPSVREGVGGEELDALTPLVLQGFVAELLQSGNKKTGGGLSPNSVNGVISVIQSSLKTAHLLGLAKEYAADKIKRPKLAEKPVECFTIAEQKRIEQAVFAGKKDKMYGILLCLYSGLRMRARKTRCTAFCFAFTAACASGNSWRCNGATSTLQRASSPSRSPATMAKAVLCDMISKARSCAFASIITATISARMVGGY